jgi:hypothetical protein
MGWVRTQNPIYARSRLQIRTNAPVPSSITPSKVSIFAPQTSANPPLTAAATPSAAAPWCSRYDMRPAAVSRSANSDPQLISSPRFRFPLQATMICIDNSEWMRNGDYAPSRFQAQADAVNLICGAKTQVPTAGLPFHRSNRSYFRSFVWARVSGIPDLIACGCWVGAVEPGEHGRRDDDGREGRPRACHSHQRPREDSRLYAR